MRADVDRLHRIVGAWPELHGHSPTKVRQGLLDCFRNLLRVKWVRRPCEIGAAENVIHHVLAKIELGGFRPTGRRSAQHAFPPASPFVILNLRRHVSVHLVETEILYLGVILLAGTFFSVVPEPVEDQDIFWNQVTHLLWRKRAGRLVTISLGAAGILEDLSTDSLDQMVAPHSHLNVALSQERITLVDVLREEHGWVFSFA